MMNTDERQPELRRAALSELEARMPERPDMVTSVIHHEIKPEAQAQYEQWLQRITPLAARFPGHRGVNVIRPAAGSSAYTITIRFDSLHHAQDWFLSEARGQLIAEARPLLKEPESVETVTGMEFWFTPSGGRPLARPWKQFLVTLAAIYPLTLIVPWALRPVFEGVPLLQQRLVGQLLVAGVIVSLMVWVIMPRLTRLVAKWLFR